MVPPLTKTQPPIFYIPIPSPGDPVPLIPTKAFVVRQPKSVFLSDFAVQSTSTGEPTEPNQVTQKASGSGQVQTDSDVDISTVPVRSPNDDVDIPVLHRPPAVGKPAHLTARTLSILIAIYKFTLGVRIEEKTRQFSSQTLVS